MNKSDWTDVGPTIIFAAAVAFTVGTWAGVSAKDCTVPTQYQDPYYDPGDSGCDHYAGRWSDC